MTKKYGAENILEAIRTHYKESVFITDGEGNIIFINEAAAKRIGGPCDYFINKNVKQLIEEGYYENSSVLQVIETKKDSVATLTYKTNNSSVSQSYPILDSDGEVAMVVTNNMSIEHNKEWEEIFVKEREANEKLRRELDYLRLKKHPKIINNSPAMKKIMQMVTAIAPTDSNIVIQGESGTGKDVMAQHIHECSSRANKSFISINCAAIPEQLLESELFGYEAGAFTGALAKGKIGLFEAAAGGTIFLDEIGDMALPLQSKLLRALENREIRRVGGVKNIPIDVRIICATNANLRKMVAEKKFREDLYYRLCVFLIDLPKLCERKDVIIPLAESFLETLNEKNGTNKVLSPIAVETMLNYTWPGNIRELRNVIERIYVVSHGNELMFTPFPAADFAPDENQKNLTVMDDFGQYNNLKDYLDTMEQKYIKYVLDECNGVIGKTAEKLGIHRSVLYRKLHK